MAQVVVMPQLGNTVESCLLTSWLVAVGDTVEAGTEICEIETDKSSMEVPAGVDGVVLALLVAEGDDVPVKDPIVVIGAPGESVEEALAALGIGAGSGAGVGVGTTIADGSAAPQGGPPSGETPGSGATETTAIGVPGVTGVTGVTGTQGVTGELGTTGVAGVAGDVAEASATGLAGELGTTGVAGVARDVAEAYGSGASGGAVVGLDVAAADRAASPRARAAAALTGVPIGALPTGSGPHGRVIERDVRAAAATAPALTQAAKGLASPLGQDPGTGLGGRLTRADLARADLGDRADTAPSSHSAAAAAAALPGTAGASAATTAVPGQSIPTAAGGPTRDRPAYVDTPLKGVRKLIAERMMHSLASSAQLTFNASAPAAGLLALRKRLKDSNPAYGLSAVTIGDLVSFAAVKVVAGYPNINAHVVDGALRSFSGVHLGFAVDTPRGLLVPTIANADRMGLGEFARRGAELAQQAIGGGIAPDLLAGASFTVSNLGAFGIESFTPLLNAPQAGILGVDAIMPRPTLDADGNPGVEMRIGFSLTVDHRVVDGADAARYLRDLAHAVEHIDVTVLR